MKKDIKKIILMNLPFVVVGYLGDKLSWLVRTAPAEQAGEKIAYAAMNMGNAFENVLPSINPTDLLMVSVQPLL